MFRRYVLFTEKQVTIKPSFNMIAHDRRIGGITEAVGSLTIAGSIFSDPAIVSDHMARTASIDETCTFNWSNYCFINYDNWYSQRQTAVVFDSSRVRKQKQRKKVKKVYTECFKKFSREGRNLQFWKQGGRKLYLYSKDVFSLPCFCGGIVSNFRQQRDRGWVLLNPSPPISVRIMSPCVLNLWEVNVGWCTWSWNNTWSRVW